MQVLGRRRSPNNSVNKGALSVGWNNRPNGPFNNYLPMTWRVMPCPIRWITYCGARNKSGQFQQAEIGLQDGGLETDFWVFTQRFYQKGYLDESSYQLCERLYTFFRQLLPPPDLIIHLVAPLEVIAARYAQRNRPLEIAQLDDLVALDALLNEWLGQVSAIPIVTVDAATEDPTYTRATSWLLAQISAQCGQD
jgi:deoxyadenosine/deoxycytidine kinase